jgi:hypothetical protein
MLMSMDFVEEEHALEKSIKFEKQESDFCKNVDLTDPQFLIQSLPLVQLPTVKSTDIRFVGFRNAYDISRTHAQRSSTLAAMLEDTSDQTLSLCDIFKNVSISKMMWTGIIVPALNAEVQEKYKLPQEKNEILPTIRDAEWYVSLILVADYLHIQYLLDKAIEEATGYIKTIFLSKQFRGCALKPFEKLPQDLLGKIAARLIDKKGFISDFKTITGSGKQFAIGNSIAHRAFSPDGNYIAGIYEDVFLYIWDIATDTPIHREVVSSGGGNARFTWAPDSKTIAVSNDARTQITMIDIQNKSQKVFCQQKDSNWLAFNSDGSMLMCATDTALVVIDVATGNVLLTLPEKKKVVACAFSPTDKLYAYATYDELQLWDFSQDIQAPKLVKVLSKMQDVKQIQFSSDGRHIAVCAWAQFFLIDVPRDATKAHVVRAFKLESGKQAGECAVNFRDQIAASVGDRVTLYDMLTGKNIRCFSESGGGSIAFSCDNNLLAYGSYKGNNLIIFKQIVPTNFTYKQSLLVAYLQKNIPQHSTSFTSVIHVVNKTFSYDPIAKFIEDSQELQDIYSTLSKEQKKTLLKVFGY